MPNKILLTITMVTAAILATPTLVYAQDTSLVQPRKTATDDSFKL